MLSACLHRPSPYNVCKDRKSSIIPWLFADHLDSKTCSSTMNFVIEHDLLTVFSYKHDLSCCTIYTRIYDAVNAALVPTYHHNIILVATSHTAQGELLEASLLSVHHEVRQSMSAAHSWNNLTPSRTQKSMSGRHPSKLLHDCTHSMSRAGSDGRLPDLLFGVQY